MLDSPLDVVCPTCNAAITGRCLEKVRDGSQYIAEVHTERIELFEGLKLRGTSN
jgi:hypothetical protein